MHNSSGVIVQESDDEGTELDSPIPIIAGLQPYRFTPRRLTQIDGVAPALDLSNATNLTHQSRGERRFGPAGDIGRESRLLWSGPVLQC